MVRDEDAATHQNNQLSITAARVRVCAGWLFLSVCFGEALGATIFTKKAAGGAATTTAGDCHDIV